MQRKQIKQVRKPITNRQPLLIISINCYLFKRLLHKQIQTEQTAFLKFIINHDLLEYGFNAIIVLLAIR